MFWKKDNDSVHPADVDTLVIIGNGFDIWQGLYTDYSKFEKYYLDNRDRILQKLGLSKSWTIDRKNGGKESLSDVEIIYGDPFQPKELSSDFWHVFENSLSKVDAEKLNMFYGKGENGLNNLSIAIHNAQDILKEAFCGWISTIEVIPEKNNFDFGDNCLFVNFNYTNTLEQRFEVSSDKIFHIHGEATDKESIIFGHSKHPQSPVEELYNFGGRFRGLYFIERLLYETDKQTYIRYINLLIFFALRGVNLSNIKHIFVLGHSFGSADFDYFNELAIATGNTNSSESTKDFFDIAPEEALHLLIGYVILTYGNDGAHPEYDAEKAQEFVHWIYQMQKEEIFKSIQRQYRRKFFVSFKYPNRLRSLESVISVKDDFVPAKWHITYYNKDDKERIEKTMRMINVKNYELYETIDKCLSILKNTK